MRVEFEKIREVFQYNVFELCKIEETHPNDYLIPYMMNDAIENYLILENAKLVGEYLTGDDVKNEGRIVEEEDGYVLIVRQNDENVFTVHFDEIKEQIDYYRYHEIGHFWVKGEEHYRQMVYILGTIYDKYEFIGEPAMNDLEMELMRLVEFAPLRAWSPVHESLEDKYPPTYEGLDCMEAFSKKANDKEYVRWIRLYRRFPNRYLESVLQKKLLSPKRQNLYNLIWKTIEAASSQYPERDYGKTINEMILEKRNQIHKKMLEKGYEGTYPEYQKEDTYVLVTEEQPFTLMEYPNYGYRVQFMASKCGKLSKINRNCGFFKGRGRQGFILSEEEF